MDAVNPKIIGYEAKLAVKLIGSLAKTESDAGFFDLYTLKWSHHKVKRI